MEGCSNNGEACPQLLDLIPRERQWLVKRADERSSEEKKLELRLGPPGEEWFFGENAAKGAKNRERDESPFSLGYFSNGNQQIHKFSSPENLQPGSVWFNQQLSQQAKATASFLQFPSKTVTTPQGLPAMAKESSQPCCTKVAVDLQQSAEKKAFSQPAPANTAVLNSSQKRYSSFLLLSLPLSVVFFLFNKTFDRIFTHMFTLLDDVWSIIITLFVSCFYACNVFSASVVLVLFKSVLVDARSPHHFKNFTTFF